MNEDPRWAVRVTGPSSDPETGWAMRNAIDSAGNVRVGMVERLRLAEKCRTVEEAEFLAFLLVAQRPKLMGRVWIKKLKPRKDRPHTWTVDENGQV